MQATAAIACPTSAELERFSLGQLAEHEAAPLHAHLLACLSCQQTIQQLPGEDTLVMAMRSQVRADAGEEPAIAELVSRLNELDPVVAAGDFSFLMPPKSNDELGWLGGYRVFKVLGAGGMGIVFEAEDVRLKRRIALKVMKPRLNADPGNRGRFLREAQAMAAIEHDHIVTVFDVGEDRGVPYLTEQLLHGETLESRLKAGPLPVATAIRIAREIAEGLSAAHERGLLHRDVKPANIWLERRNDNGERVKILDFGLARIGDCSTTEFVKAIESALETLGPTATHPGTLLGTPHYMSPEQARGGEISHRSDLFSLGCVLYRMLSGTVPFGGKTTQATLNSLICDSPRLISELVQVPHGLAALIDKLLAKQPENRPASARTVANELAAMECAGARSVARKKRRTLAAGAFVAILLAAIPFALIERGQIVRYLDDKGRLIVESDDAELELVIKHDGAMVAVADRNAGWTKTLPSGHYEIELPIGSVGWELDSKQLTLRRGRDLVVKPTRLQITSPIDDGPPREIVRFTQHVDNIHGVSLFANDRRVLSASGPNTLRVWDTATGREVFELRGHVEHLLSSAASSKGYRAISSAQHGEVRVWDLLHAKQMHVHAEDHEVNSVAISHDGTRALIGSITGLIRLWEVETWTELRRYRLVEAFDHTNGLWSVAFNRDGSRILAAGAKGNVRSWDTETGKLLHRYEGHTNGVWQAVYSPDDRFVLSAGSDNTAILWDAKTGKRLHQFGGNTAHIKCVAFTPDSRRALTGSNDGILCLWDTSTGQQLNRFRVSDCGLLRMCVAQDGRFVVLGGFDHVVRVWRLPPFDPSR